MILLGDRGTQVQVACPRPVRNGAQLGLEPATNKSQARRPINCATAYIYTHTSSFHRASICEGGLGSRNSVRPSVRLSVRLSVSLSVTRVHCDKTK